MGSDGHMTSDSMYKGAKQIGRHGGLDRDSGGCCRTVAGHPLDVYGYSRAGPEGGKPTNLRLRDRMAI